MARKPKGSHWACRIRSGLPQLNYYSKILTELYMHKSMAELL